MKTYLLLCLAACGGVDGDEPQPHPTDVPSTGIEAGGPVTPYLSVNGETSPLPGAPEWYPTGVAFDSRGAGWRLSCLNGRMPAVTVWGDGFIRVRCPDEVAP